MRDQRSRCHVEQRCQLEERRPQETASGGTRSAAPARTEKDASKESLNGATEAEDRNDDCWPSLRGTSSAEKRPRLSDAERKGESTRGRLMNAKVGRAGEALGRLVFKNKATDADVVQKLRNVCALSSEDNCSGSVKKKAKMAKRGMKGMHRLTRPGVDVLDAPQRGTIRHRA